MSSRFLWWVGVLVLIFSQGQLSAADSSNATLPAASSAVTGGWQQRGLYVHDPSTLAKCGSEYWIFSTGPGIATRHSRDLKTWINGPRIFSAPPPWTSNVPKFKGYFWAPDVVQVENRYLVYYSVSSWGTNASAIGLVTNPTLDPGDPAYAWTDQGMVCQSSAEDTFNTIDPSVMRDTDGSLWLAFGSFWSGIKLIQLDTKTGKRLAPDSPMYSVAYHDTIEAACLCRHNDYCYLFVNWGLCCRGTNSTYNIRVGRSARVTGPYLDQAGKDLAQGGGTLFLESEGTFVGPGHAGVYHEGDADWFSCHFYDGARGGAATLSVQKLAWTADGWPVGGKR